jgi:hypothetical protein
MALPLASEDMQTLQSHSFRSGEPVFVNLLRNPGIDSQPGGPVRQPLLTYRPARARICKRLWSPGIDSEESTFPSYVARLAGTANRVVVQAHQAGNRFLGSLKGLQIRAQAT